MQMTVIAIAAPDEVWESVGEESGVGVWVTDADDRDIAAAPRYPRPPSPAPRRLSHLCSRPHPPSQAFMDEEALPEYARLKVMDRATATRLGSAFVKTRYGILGTGCEELCEMCGWVDSDISVRLKATFFEAKWVRIFWPDS